MKAFELYNEKGETCGVWVCGECRRIPVAYYDDPAHPGSLPVRRNCKELAEECCTPCVCETCGVTFDPKYQRRENECSKCDGARWLAKQNALHMDRLESAEDVTETYKGGFLWIRGVPGVHTSNNGFFESVVDLTKHIELHDEYYEDQVWAFACTPRSVELDIDNAIENLCSDGYEDMEDMLTIPQSLKDGVEEFNRINKNVLDIWEVDYTRKIRVCKRLLKQPTTKPIP